MADDIPGYLSWHLSEHDPRPASKLAYSTDT